MDGVGCGARVRLCCWSFFRNNHAKVGTPADEKLLYDESISERTPQVLYRGLGGDTYI